MTKQLYQAKVVEIQNILRSRFHDILVNADFFEVKEETILVISVFWNKKHTIMYNNSHTFHYSDIPDIKKIEYDILGYFNNI